MPKTHLELGKSVVLRLSVLLPRRLVVSHHVSCKFSCKRDPQLCLGAGREVVGELVCGPLLGFVKRREDGILLLLQCVGVEGSVYCQALFFWSGSNMTYALPSSRSDVLRTILEVSSLTSRLNASS
jgi:hypothetical protein